MPSIARIVHQHRQRDREWAGPKKNIPPSVLITIDLESRDADGELLRGSTWTWGFGSEKVVLRRWRRHSPSLAAIEVGHVAVVNGHPKVFFDSLAPLGPRVKVKDRALERAAVGL